MKNSLLIILLFVFTFTGALAQSGKKSRSLKPSNYIKRVTTVISEKSRNYYSLSEKEAAVITVQGPGKLRVITRGRFTSTLGNKINYQINYVVNGGEQEQTKISKVEPSKKANYKNEKLGKPGQSRDFEIELGRGYHNIEFKLENKNTLVAARYIFIPGKAKKQEWISFSPIQPAHHVELISREESISYYRFSPEEPLKVQVNGPTELRILTRIEYHYQMKGRINYRLQVKENDKIINSYQLSSRRSEIAIYKQDKDLIPGKAREFVIKVPEGRHTYEIIPLDKDKSNMLGRILLPKKDVKLKN